MAQIFLSHTKRDSSFCDTFDTIASRVGIKVFRSEFEDIKSPPWKTIKDTIAKSNALFLLVGKELVKSQARARAEYSTETIRKTHHNSDNIQEQPLFPPC